MYEINITETARADLHNAVLYIANTLNNKAAAIRLLDTAEKEISSLADFPERNPLVRDDLLAANGIRVQNVKKYLAFYAVRNETNSVTVLRIIHSRRDWISILKEDINV
ncbi:MAG: type II toxin-antitoxin system RelE/ParE family toxin [Ruminococcus sp.]|nr:type II toxin-antitoxin system RelE/ParE family toxin [Ruminococcus sp.]